MPGPLSRIRDGHHVILLFRGEPQVALPVHSLNGIREHIDEGEPKLIGQRGDRRHRHIVFLDVEAETLLRRLHNGQGLFQLGGDIHRDMRWLLDSRVATPVKSRIIAAIFRPWPTMSCA
jgi:hypothetical protein